MKPGNRKGRPNYPVEFKRGGPFDPDAFDKRVANSALLRMGWNGWGKK